MHLTDWITTLLALIGVWIGATLAVKPIDEIAKKTNSSSFIVSFFLLGMFTSLTEVSVAINSYIDKSIEISVGNLLGGVLVLLLFVIPLLGILAKGVKLNNGFGVTITFLSLILLLVPHFFLINKTLSFNESIIIFILYIVFSIILFLKNKKKSVIKQINKRKNKKTQIKLAKLIIFITLGSVILIISSNQLVLNMDKIGTSLSISPFILSLLGLSIGTNLPEISLAIVAVIKGRAEIGFGNYLGSALFNLLILSILGIASNGITINEDFTLLLVFSVIGFALFFLFIKSKNTLSRKEGLFLILIYIVFILSELT